MNKEDVIEILERFVIGAKPCSQIEIVDACASAYRMLKEQPSLPSNLDEAAEEYSLDVKAKPFENLVKEAFKHGAIWRDYSQITKLPSNLDEAAKNRVTENGRFEITSFEQMRIDDIMFGAEWMAGQGQTFEAHVDSGCAIASGVKLPFVLWDTYEDGDVLKVQIRKKQ